MRRPEREDRCPQKTSWPRYFPFDKQPRENMDCVQGQMFSSHGAAVRPSRPRPRILCNAPEFPQQTKSIRREMIPKDSKARKRWPRVGNVTCQASFITGHRVNEL